MFLNNESHICSFNLNFGVLICLVLTLIICWKDTIQDKMMYFQMNDIVSLRSEVKQLATVAQQLEPYVKTLSSQTNLEEVANLQALIDRISVLQASEQHQ